MEYQSIVSAIDEELAKLQKVRALLQKGGNIDGLIASRAGKRSSNPKRVVRRKLSAEARARIAEAQKKRWAAARKSAK